ncbi:aldo/keto reductase [Nonomuraea turcica]|uniref:aldo/keto reductase n=1 Tax=Nonomuraea sp. G32 TaxID=3067274 RepID=UPI00273C4007|nr:aldo/keto reductase [Nonomuraea sp. G32]MDP4503992.1 hypothetical protein [Nonomuraea sp. G32]
MNNHIPTPDMNEQQKRMPIGNDPKTRRDVSVPSLGAMLFGTTTDETTSFTILDRFVEAGGSFIDTANNYAYWVNGTQGGERRCSVAGAAVAALGMRSSSPPSSEGSPTFQRPPSPTTLRACLGDGLGRHPEFGWRLGLVGRGERDKKPVADRPHCVSVRSERR